MGKITDVVWSALYDAVSQAKGKDARIIFHDEMKGRFEELFYAKYEFVKEHFMKASVESLDGVYDIEGEGN